MTEDVRLKWPNYFDLESGKNAIREFHKDVPELVSSEVGDLIEEGDIVIGNGKMIARHDNGEIKIKTIYINLIINEKHYFSY